jgi:HK97 family phage portal protein
LSLSPVDADYINYSNLKVQDIGRIFGVNNSMLNIDGTSNLTGEQVYQSFYADTLLPDATNFEQECWEKLLTDNEKERLEFRHSFSSLIRANSNDRADYVTKMVNIGGMSPNEAALLNGNEEVIGGDERQIQTNLIPLSKQGQWIDGKIARDTAGTANNNNPNGNNQDNGGV